METMSFPVFILDHVWKDGRDGGGGEWVDRMRGEWMEGCLHMWEGWVGGQ